jgi:hypothetical protein
MLLLLWLMVSCRDCHRDIADRYAQTPMANSSGAVVASAEPEGGFFHSPSQTRYTIRRAGEALRLEWDGGGVRLSFFIGSRRMGRSYAFSENGHLYQAPVGYYANKAQWDMAPGYALDRQPDLDRPITAECLFCHATGARAEAGTLNRFTALTSAGGIGCERCHGDGARHSAAPARGNIVNPARLPKTLRAAVCEQCHLAGAARVPLPGKRLEQFQPGEALSDYLDVFVSRASGGVRVNGHADALARSRCAQSGDLWCGSCHNPHRPAANYREKCLACHAEQHCPSPRRAGDCTACHMPKARAYDGGHTVFTDHSIPRRARGAGAAGEAIAELSPYFSRALPAALAGRNLGIAYASAGAIGNSWPLVRAAVQAKPLDPILYTQVALHLEADGRNEQAIEFYRMALAIDEEQDAALARLGLLLAKRGETGQARRLLQKSLARNPRQPAIAKALAALK